mmetsp:Transcript_8353/g.14160  ORF Transcript_8353/g.14160 Transcript_8353/m.14160 type:complete len:179 (-) Transcript_8353:92-628(-)|eukprot:CAMPEP_0114430726 /NCGR_PEP_ID=MMETSP0103-20121206/10197_1 /TAXON_ID=37642 ORGANISM="Paraphysomonas imperforata, Strain PA2" /NCGR_SAMPLE_ID=MMETSP0103 /ASSEMBLY_ACC=CAM_ASM_000201 /LENGTH=178 /DNA_ID=CAMNT_0001600197 /DNA_START=36 /DNA_END=572 /DNA_ORIENTATION=-
MSEPEWLSNSEKTSSVEEGTPTTTSTPANDGPEVPHKTLVQGVFSFLLFGTAILMAFTGTKAVIDTDSGDDIGALFIGLYMFLFAVILFVYEVTCVKPIAVVDDFYSKNFGFLYGPVGKGLYLLFISIMAFGVADDDGNPTTNGIITGVITLLMSVLHLGCAFRFPEYFDKKEKYHPK